jgi:hypothetical protein
MPRKRMIDPMFWDDEDVARLTRDERLLLIGIFNFADDYGHNTAEPRILRKWIFGYDDDLTLEDVATMIEHIVATCANVEMYWVEGKPYLWLRKWERHQDLRFRARGQYPCHVCGKIHDSKDYAGCKDLPVADAYMCKDYVSPTQELAQPLPPRQEKRREEKTSKDTRCEGLAQNVYDLYGELEGHVVGGMDQMHCANLLSAGVPLDLIREVFEYTKGKPDVRDRWAYVSKTAIERAKTYTGPAAVVDPNNGVVRILSTGGQI